MIRPGVKRSIKNNVFPYTVYKNEPVRLYNMLIQVTNINDHLTPYTDAKSWKST